MRLRACAVGLLLMASAACSSNQMGEASLNRSRDVITAEEALEASGSTAYDVVRSRRPSWLRTRGAQSISQPSQIVIYLDGIRLGGPESLRQVQVGGIREIRFLDAPTATQRWGTGHALGAIQVITR